MKFFLLIIIFSCFIFVASYIFFLYNVRFKFYKDCIFICENLKNNISFNKNIISDIISNCYSKLSNTTKFVLKNIEKNNIKILRNNDSELFNRFLISLGKGDVDYEINNINYYQLLFNDEMNTSKEELIKKGLTYFKLIIALCVVVIILLL